MILYHHNSSVCAAKIRIALAEKSLPWESRLMRLDGDQFDPAYLALNPAAVVPTLVHEGRAIAESNVILEYLDDVFPEPPLRPADPFARAQARILMMRLDGDRGIHYAASVVTYAIAYRHHLIANASGEDRAALTKAVARNMNPKSRAWLENVVIEGIEAPEFTAALTQFDDLLADFQSRLASSQWLAGNNYSIADIAFSPYMIRLDLLQLDRLWQTRPAVAAWYDRLRERASTAEVLDWYDPVNIDTLTTRGLACTGAIGRMLDRERTP